MGRAAVILMLVTACMHPSQSRRRGYLTGGLVVAAGGGLVGASLLGHCTRQDGLFNNCDFAKATGITLGAILAGLGLLKLGIEVAAP